MFYTTDDLRDKEIFLQLAETKEAIPESNEMYDRGDRKVRIYRFEI